MNILVDTSVWSEALRRSKEIKNSTVQELKNLINLYQVGIIGAIRQEILSGIKEHKQFKKLNKYLSAFPDIALVTDDYINAELFFNLCRAKGIQGSNTDFLICAVAVRNRMSIFTTDKDFELYSKIIPIKLHSKYT